MPNNLLGDPEPTLLPDQTDSAVGRALEEGTSPADVAAAVPTASRAWAELADQAWSDGEVIASYAYARVGYHRGLDALRRNGWRGAGPVPWSHGPNRGFLRSVYALGRAASSIGEKDEEIRCSTFLHDCDPTASQELAR